MQRVNQQETNEWITLSEDYVALPKATNKQNSKMKTEDMARGYGLIRVIAYILERIISQHTQKASSSFYITKFHNAPPLNLSLVDYLLRIHKYAACSTESFVLGLIYIDRLEQAIATTKDQTILSQHSMHRIVLTSIALAAKFFDDQYYNNAFYAKIGGISGAEMNELERLFLTCVNFRLHVTMEEYSRYYNELSKHKDFITAHKEISPLYSREIQILYPKWMYDGYNNNTTNGVQNSNKVLEHVEYSVKHDTNGLLSYVTTFMYDNNIRVVYMESLESSLLRCSTYIARARFPPSPKISPIARTRCPPYASPITDRVIPSVFGGQGREPHQVPCKSLYTTQNEINGGTWSNYVPEMPPSSFPYSNFYSGYMQWHDCNNVWQQPRSQKNACGYLNVSNGGYDAIQMQMIHNRRATMPYTKNTREMKIVF